MSVRFLMHNPNRLYVAQCITFLVVLGFVFSCASPYFLSLGNLNNVLTASAVIGLMAIGTTFVIASGAIDLSSAAVMALCGTACAWCMQKGGWPPLLAILFSIGLGGLCGFITGLLINITKAPSFIVTLGMLSVVRAIAYIISHGMPIYGLDENIINLGQGQILGVPVAVALLIAGAILALILLTTTQFGAHVLALGDDTFAAAAMGVPTGRLHLKIFTLAGFYSGIAGIIFMLRTNSGDPTAGQNYELIAITAVILGGANLFWRPRDYLRHGSRIFVPWRAAKRPEPACDQFLLPNFVRGPCAADGSVPVAGRVPAMTLALENISKSFGSLQVLQNINLRFETGQVTAIVGDNGAGKSTLLKLMAGIHTPDEGHIRLGDTELTKLQSAEHRRRGIEMVYQELALARQQDVVTNLWLGREITHTWFAFLDRKAMARRAGKSLTGSASTFRIYASLSGFCPAGSGKQLPLRAPFCSIPKYCCLMNQRRRLPRRKSSMCLMSCENKKRMAARLCLSATA